MDGTTDGFGAAGSPCGRNASPAKRPREEPGVSGDDDDDERSTQEDVQDPGECGTPRPPPPPPPAPDTAYSAMRERKSSVAASLVRLCAGPFRPVLGRAADLPRRGRVVCLDVETTGFAAADAVLEIGAVELVDGVRTGVLFQTYLRPRAPIGAAARTVHGLDEPLLRAAGALAPRVAVASFVAWVGRAPCVSHNAAFDARMLNQELVAAGYQHARDAPTNPVFCTMACFRLMHPELPCSLDAVARFFSLPARFRSMAHSALADAEMCAMCFQRLLQESSPSHK